MSHMVIYRGSDGKPGYHQTDDIHDAVGFVEQMRNDQGVEHARIFRLEEVEFQYKPYYRVELSESLGGANLDQAGSGSAEEITINVNGEDSASPANGSSDKTLAPVTAAADASGDTADLEDAAEAASRRGLFGR